jgi:glycine/D-amino acid oxidase-like deaminating enzyme
MLSYWEESGLNPHTHLLVVGAGLVGLSAAYHYKLKHPHAVVRVVEQTLLPENASTRNAGFACFGSITEIQDDLQHETEAAVRNRIAARWEGLQFLRATLGDAAIQYEACGGYELFTDPAAFERAVADVPRINAWLKDITGEPFTYTLGERRGYKTIHNKLEGALHSGRMLHALLHKAQAAGVQLLAGHTVTKAETGAVHLATGHTLQAQNILLATNAHTAALLPQSGIEPGRGYVLLTNELKQQPWHGTWHYDRGYVYFRHVGHRVLLGGGRNLDYDGERTTTHAVNPRIKAWLVQFATEVLKLEPGWRIDREWTGIMGFTDTRQPVLQPVQPGVYVAAGLGGMGVALGMLFGKQASEMVG